MISFELGWVVALHEVICHTWWNLMHIWRNVKQETLSLTKVVELFLSVLFVWMLKRRKFIVFDVIELWTVACFVDCLPLCKSDVRKSQIVADRLLRWIHVRFITETNAIPITIYWYWCAAVKWLLLNKQIDDRWLQYSSHVGVQMHSNLREIHHDLTISQLLLLFC